MRCSWSSAKLFPVHQGICALSVFLTTAKLTVIGVVIACVAWPVVTRISSAPRWLFLRMAIAVTLVLWLPDIYILVRGAPGRAVAVLMVMHLAIALVTYNALVHIAKTKPLASVTDPVPGQGRHRAGGDVRCLRT